MPIHRTDHYKTHYIGSLSAEIVLRDSIPILGKQNKVMGLELGLKRELYYRGGVVQTKQLRAKEQNKSKH